MLEASVEAFKRRQCWRWAVFQSAGPEQLKTTLSWFWINAWYIEKSFTWGSKISAWCVLNQQNNKTKPRLCRIPKVWSWPRSYSGCTLQANMLNIWLRLHNAALLHTIAQVNAIIKHFVQKSCQNTHHCVLCNTWFLPLVSNLLAIDRLNTILFVNQPLL